MIDKNKKLFFYRESTMFLEFSQIEEKIVDTIARIEKVLVAEIKANRKSVGI